MTDTVTLAAACPDDKLAAAVNLVRRYLVALEARDIDTAQAQLAADVQITGPGGAPAGSVAQIVARSAQRYQAIGKHFERFDAFASADGKVTVYCIGTLHGRWLDGTGFDGIRFIDRFDIQDNRIIRQEVWNDTAEHRIRRQQ